ncbi:topoisomerase C-terminal repeat-containing protein [Puia sp. P3]|uniref:topoisomerase C-terminal repeat-containing protein n=1 Tax=Puia sp. P3 TaxID=3423952 RepID=UPI003D67C1B5
MGRYGPMVQIGDVNDEEKPRFAKLKNTQSIETISYDEAMELFRLPRNLGPFEEKDVTVNIGRFGPYIAHDGKFYSLGKEFDPYTITFDQAAPIVVEKRSAKEQRTIKVFEKEKIQLLRGPYGPYIKQGLRNYKLPKEKQDNAADLTIEEVKAIIEEVKANPPKRVPRKKKEADVRGQSPAKFPKTGKGIPACRSYPARSGNHFARNLMNNPCVSVDKKKLVGLINRPELNIVYPSDLKPHAGE